MRSALAALSVSFAALGTGCVEGTDAPLVLGDAAPVVRDAGASDAPVFVGRDAGPPPEDLDGFVAWQMAAGGLPGVAAAVVTRDGVTWQGTYGFANVEAMRPIDEGTLFTVASVSKPVAAVAVLQLVEEGRIDLDAPVAGYVGFPVVHPAASATPITTRMLFTHSSGVVDNFALLFRTGTMGDPTIPLRDFLVGYVTDGGAYYAAANFGEAPGTRWDYSNAGFALGAYVAEGVTGEPVAARVRARVMLPLGMTASGYYLADVDAAALATPYSYSRGRGLIALEAQSWAYYPSATLRTSLRDLGRFARAMLRDGELDGARVLAATTVSELRRRQVSALRRSQGLVWSYETIGAHEYLAHSGAALEGSAMVALRWDAGVGIVLLSNSDAYVRAIAGLTEGRTAFEAILERLDAETPP